MDWTTEKPKRRGQYMMKKDSTAEPKDVMVVVSPQGVVYYAALPQIAPDGCLWLGPLDEMGGE